MNDRDLKNGLRQLSNDGWIVAEVTDDFLEVLFAWPTDVPSDEIKERCLSRLRAKIKDEIERQAGEPFDLSHKLPVEIDRKVFRARGNKKGPREVGA